MQPFLVSHLEHCPINESVVDAVSEQTLVAWDTDSNIVASTRVDLHYRTADGKTHLRETKTLNHTRFLPDEESRLLDHFPQVALSICLLADDPQSDAGTVELELLGEDFGSLIRYDASDEAVVLNARTALADIVDSWLHDTSHAPASQSPCALCPMREVCPHVDEGAQGADVDDIAALSLQGTPSWEAGLVAAVVDELASTGAVEDLPF